MRYKAQRGTQDVVPAQAHAWQRLEHTFAELAHLYGYREIRTPVFEDTDLFVRSSGETSDIVTKQMYSFEDKGGRNITLKPEGTAPAMRALVEHNLCPPGTVARLWYTTPIYRYERPQKGRLREAHQVGLELAGSTSPEADAEIITMTVRFYQRLGLENIEVLLNSLGRDECRTRYREAILAHAAAYLADCDLEEREKAEKNPLRLLDSKDPSVQAAMQGGPSVLDYLEEASKHRLEAIRRLLDEANVPYRVAPEIVRGLDYYTETVFEVQSGSLGAQSSLCGGGRFDHLVQEIGGADTPCVGVAMGIERALMVLEAEGKLWPQPPLGAFVAYLGEAGRSQARKTCEDLRANGVPCTMDLDGKSLKSQMKQADRLLARFVVILGEDELDKGVATVRELSTGEQTCVPLGQIGMEIHKKL